MTKEMIVRIEEEVSNYNDQEILDYHYTYTSLNKHYANSYYVFRIQKSLEEINRRGLDLEGYMKSVTR